jgi:hypothetical protein
MVTDSCALRDEDKYWWETLGWSSGFATIGRMWLWHTWGIQLG